VLQQPDGNELVYALEQGRTVTIGRDAGNTIVLNSQFVSKRHALVSWGPRGVRIEDQDSANGITVNGLTVHAAQLSTGDTIQIGDQRIVYEAEGQQATPGQVAAPASAGGNKMLRLVLVAGLTLCLMIGGLMAVYLLVLRPAPESTVASAGAVREDPSLPADTPITPFDSPEARLIDQQALAAKGTAVDWIYDEGVLAYRNGRLLDAYRLLHGVLFRQPAHAAGRRELLRVMGARALRLRGYQAAAERAEEESKFEDAARQWEQIQALTLQDEPLNARARTETARLQQRTSR